MVSKKQAVKNASWRKVTDEKAASLDYICQWCGHPGQRVSPKLLGYLDGHHIIKRRFNIHTPENCYIAHRLSCHRFIEDNNINVTEYPDKTTFENRGKML
jgi:5-methylcytosine-specific restriction endonuclease McrA